MSTSTIHEPPAAGHHDGVPVLPQGAYVRVELARPCHGVGESETLVIVAVHPTSHLRAVVPGSRIPDRLDPREYAGMLADAYNGRYLAPPAYLLPIVAPRGWGGCDRRTPYGQTANLRAHACLWCGEHHPAGRDDHDLLHRQSETTWRMTARQRNTCPCCGGDVRTAPACAPAVLAVAS